jgi:hypothetical protein
MKIMSLFRTPTRRSPKRKEKSNKMWKAPFIISGSKRHDQTNLSLLITANKLISIILIEN